jgi:hypothetical protein
MGGAWFSSYHRCGGNWWVKPPLGPGPVTAYSWGLCPMNYQAFTNDSPKMMYEAMRGALTSDDVLKAQNG